MSPMSSTQPGSRPFIPQANPGASYTTRRAAIDAALQQTLASGWYIHGEQGRAFEAEFAQWLGLPATGAAGVGSGTDAVELALRALHIGPGDEVITVAHTAVATVAAIERAGAQPVLVDIDPLTFTIDPQLAAAAVTPRTRAIVAVHLYGLPADLSALLAIAERHTLALIEDCAQAHGATYHGQRVGTFGQIAAFSFYPTKNLGAFGDGGAVVSADTARIDTVRQLAEYGWRERYISAAPGFNSRLDEVQAAILRVKLPDLDRDNGQRAAIASRYSAGLAGCVTVPTVPPDRQSAFHLYVIRHSDRDRLQTHLKAQGIGTAIQYPVPIHLQAAYRGRLGDSGSLPHTEQAAREILSLPLFPELADSDVDAVIEAVRAF